MLKDSEIQNFWHLQKRNEFIAQFEKQYCRWETLRADRLEQEEQFENFTGHIDIIEMHIPYTNYGYLFDLMEKTKRLDTPSKILVCAGDSLNLDMFSAFYQRSVDRSKPSVEWQDLLKVLRYAENIYNHVVFMCTNHDNRLWKMLMKNVVAKEIYDEVLNWMISYEDAFVHERFTKIKTIHYVFFQIGNIIISHFENNSIVPGVIPRDVIKYLTPRIKKRWDIVIQAHTHAQSKIVNDRKIAIECGSLTKTLDYWRRGSMKGKGKLTSLGYAVCDMVDGIADPNKTNFVWCEHEDWL